MGCTKPTSRLMIGTPLGLMLVLAAGCAQRTMTITSDPPGALVYMNNQEIGRTPLTRDFTWYGWYDVQVRKEGYQTLSTRTRLIAPIWAWPPIDFLAELWPFHAKDHRYLHYALQPATTEPADPELMFAKAAVLRSRLESSKYTRTAATQPAPVAEPTTRPVAQVARPQPPATAPSH